MPSCGNLGPFVVVASAANLDGDPPLRLRVDEAEALCPCAAEACNALLGVYVRVVEPLLVAKKGRDERRSLSSLLSKRMEEVTESSLGP